MQQSARQCNVMQHNATQDIIEHHHIAQCYNSDTTQHHGLHHVMYQHTAMVMANSTKATLFYCSAIQTVVTHVYWFQIVMNPIFPISWIL